MNAQLKEVPTLGANGLDVRRTGKITGSRVAAILGLSPYSKRADVMREMIREHYGVETEFKGNIATEHGQRHEQDAIAWYEAQTGDLVVMGRCGWLSWPEQMEQGNVERILGGRFAGVPVECHGGSDAAGNGATGCQPDPAGR